ncbi:MAG: hypothetical protein M3R49_07500 [Chloroflexota bacterium]|nr:hypothetical protein [Chloroflexota bacterium]
MNRRRPPAAWGTAFCLALLLLPAEPAAAFDAVPTEPGAIVLPPAPTLQALAGDLDGDGNRELLRLVQDETEATLLEVWREAGGRWSRADRPIQVRNGQAPGPGRNTVYAAAPARLLVWHEGSAERVLIVTQPRFELRDVGPVCCLLIEKVILDRGGLRLDSMGGHSNSVDAILALDLDGDGTDELLTTRSLPPAGDISYPIEARVYRLDGQKFGQPSKVELPFGSGDSPFLLGDTDGQPGQEAGLIGTLGPPGLFRIRMDALGTLIMDRSGLRGATAAVPFALRDGEATAVTETNTVQLVDWPADSEPRVLADDKGASGVLGIATTPNGPLLLLELDDGSRLRTQGPDLHFGPTIDAGPNAVLLALRSLRLYHGPLPGGGYAGSSAAIFGGRLVGSLGPSAGRELDQPIAPLVDTVPVGLVGSGNASLAMLHADLLPGRMARGGGVLEELTPSPQSWLSIAPIDEVLRAGAPPGSFEPAIEGAVRNDARPATLVTSATGFHAHVSGPPGSRVAVFGMGATPQQVLPASGVLSVAVEPPKSDTANPQLDAGLVVLTPAGQAYVVDWTVQVLTEPPSLVAVAVTPFLSSHVRLSGHAPPGTRLTLNGSSIAAGSDGRFAAEIPAPPWPSEVRLEATDLVGNQSTRVLSVVGLFDYRRLPWIPIVVLMTLAVAVALFLRGPRARRLPLADGDARLEEIEEA